MLEYRILGNQPEPSLVEAGLEIIDFEVRCKNEDVFEQGKMIIENYVDQNPELEGSQIIIDDPMTVGLYPSHDEDGNMYDAKNVSPYYFNELVKELEDLGFYGKAAGYKDGE